MMSEGSLVYLKVIFSEYRNDSPERSGVPSDSNSSVAASDA
jgi:hypothetical protein